MHQSIVVPEYPQWRAHPLVRSRPSTHVVHGPRQGSSTSQQHEIAARNSVFGAIIVQGGVTSAILNAVVAEELPGPGTVFLHVDWNFRAPVRPGDTIEGAVEILEVRADKPITKLRTTVTRDDGVVALEGEALCYTVPLDAAS